MHHWKPRARYMPDWKWNEPQNMSRNIFFFFFRIFIRYARPTKYTQTVGVNRSAYLRPCRKSWNTADFPTSTSRATVHFCQVQNWKISLLYNFHPPVMTLMKIKISKTVWSLKAWQRLWLGIWENSTTRVFIKARICVNLIFKQSCQSFTRLKCSKSRF